MIIINGKKITQEQVICSCFHLLLEGDADIDVLSFGLDNPGDIDTDNGSIKQEVVDMDNNGSIEQHSSSFVTFDCTEPHCVMQFRREDRLRAHLLIGSHKIMVPSFHLPDKAAIIYKQRLEDDILKEIPILTSTNRTVTGVRIPTVPLTEGWALFRPRAKVTFTPTQRSYLHEKYDEGEKSGAKWDPSKLSEVSFSLFLYSLNHIQSC